MKIRTSKKTRKIKKYKRTKTRGGVFEKTSLENYTELTQKHLFKVGAFYDFQVGKIKVNARCSRIKLGDYCIIYEFITDTEDHHPFLKGNSFEVSNCLRGDYLDSFKIINNGKTFDYTSTFRGQ